MTTRGITEKEAIQFNGVYNYCGTRCLNRPQDYYAGAAECVGQCVAGHDPTPGTHGYAKVVDDKSRYSQCVAGCNSVGMTKIGEILACHNQCVINH